jgi:membrane-bound lytic murein transglycosylase D
MRIRRAACPLAALGLLISTALTPAAALAGPSAKPPAHAKPGPKAAPAPAKGGKRGPAKHTRKAGEAGEPDENLRRVIAGIPHPVRESPELRAMRELDRALFPATLPGAGTPWIAEGTPLIERGEPQVIASGLPPPVTVLSSPPPEPARDLSWLRSLTMPDIPVRWDARVVRYLEFYLHHPRGRSMVAGWLKKSGRYGAAIRRTLRENNLPEDILWLALVESGFDPTISSPAGAAGLWQFMPEGARIYGLTVDRWIDERLDPERSTVAAARYLADLHTRFGTWELAFAAYNMGYGGLLASIRKYNTNDFWELARLESGMPLETALYVPKIVAMAIVSRNRAAFGLQDVELDPAVSFDKLSVRSGVSLQSVALAAGTSLDKLAELNPQLTAGRAPPALTAAEWDVRVPAGSAAKAARGLPSYADAEPKVERHVVRWGESLDEILTRHRVSRGVLASLNGLRRDESLRPGTVLLVPVPRADDLADAAYDASPGKPFVVVPAEAFSYPDRKRVFYRVVSGDTLRDVAGLFGITADELCRWNALDPTATLHDGMALQVYAPTIRPRSDVLVLEEKDTAVLPVGSMEFFSHFEGLRGRTRFEHVAKKGDTWRSVAHKYGLSVAQLERINGRGRSTALNPGDKLVVYAAAAKAPKGAPAQPEKRPVQEKASEAVAMAEAPVVTKSVHDHEGAPAAPAADDAAVKDDTVGKPAAVMVPVGLPVKPALGAGPAKGGAAANR